MKIFSLPLGVGDQINFPSLSTERGYRSIYCPVCGEHQVHFMPDRVWTFSGNERYQAYEMLKARTALSIEAFRGSGMVIPYWCEQGHYFEQATCFHKGSTFVQTVYAAEAEILDFEDTCR